MKSLSFLFSIIFLSFLLIQCGGNPEAEGDDFYAQGKYKQALSKYLEVKKNQPQNSIIDEKIALAYMQYGNEMFEKRSSLTSFVGNFEKAQEYIHPDEAGPDFKKEYSKTLYKLAVAYNTTKPDNEIQKEQYFSSTLENLEKALEYDPQNTEAEALLSEIKSANFQKMYDKGMEFYKQAKKEKTNGDLYLSAEFYLKRAVSFDPLNEEAKKQLSLIRKETLSIANPHSDFPYVVAAMQYRGPHLFIAFTGFNNIGEDMTFDPAKLILIDEEGNEYDYDKEQTAELKGGLTTAKVLKARERLDCDLAYKIAKSVKLSRLSYEMDNGAFIDKYFP
ncbi:MAG: hypothetical protein JXR46_09275 [Calditrichaceae bacterium]|nr:hypothetical protein [Calditrichaceae bacterium]MBN2709222.1 hypothetical protein [Calditrichaceae bacterium]RQV96175.1 MAG: hypothetical protein EH224_05585 [Calditrichota bacterium]